MIGHIHTIIGKVKQVFVQLLDSLNLVDNIPTGMVDSIAANNATYINSNCWQYSSGSYYLIPGLLTTDTVEVYGNSDIPTIPNDGELHLAIGQKAYGITIKRGGVELAYYPASSYILDPLNFIMFDTLQINSPYNARLINGTPLNRGIQNEYNYSQLGQNDTRYFIPIPNNHFVISNPQGDVTIDIATQSEISGTCNSPLPSKIMYAETVNQQKYTGPGTKYRLRTKLLYELSPNFFRIQLRVNNENGQTIANYAPTHLTPGEVVDFEDTITTSFSGNIGDPLVLILASDGNYGDFNWSDFIIDTEESVPVLKSNNLLDCVGNNIEVLQDGFSFLNTGVKIKNADIQELKEADIHNVWFDPLGIPKEVTFAELEMAISTYPEVYGGDVIPGKSIKNISLK